MYGALTGLVRSFIVNGLLFGGVLSCSLVQQASPEEFFAFLDSESRRQESQGMHVASFPYSKWPNTLERHEGS